MPSKSPKLGDRIKESQAAIREWLQTHHARRIDLAGELKAYSVGGEILIYQDMGADGWQVFTPSRAVTVSATLAELDLAYSAQVSSELLTSVQREHAAEVRAGRPGNLYINRAAQLAWYAYVEARGASEGVDRSARKGADWKAWCDLCGVPS